MGVGGNESLNCDALSRGMLGEDFGFGMALGREKKKGYAFRGLKERKGGKGGGILFECGSI